MYCSESKDYKDRTAGKRWNVFGFGSQWPRPFKVRLRGDFRYCHTYSNWTKFHYKLCTLYIMNVYSWWNMINILNILILLRYYLLWRIFNPIFLIFFCVHFWYNTYIFSYCVKHGNIANTWQGWTRLVGQGVFNLHFCRSL